jgi:hypothetical protein
MELRTFPDGGFVARGAAGPQRGAPRDWVVWHFTHIDNLPGIASAGRLMAASGVTPQRDVANRDVKTRRARRVVDPDANYPPSVVNDHVPFYIAAKSPMLYVMSRGHSEYQGGCEPLIFLGAFLGDIIDAGLSWCISDSNAATQYAAFSRNVDMLGSFVDFDLLRERDWYNTSEDQDRKSRRAAEALVLRSISLELISLVVARSVPMLKAAQELLESVSGVRQYLVKSEMYY